MQRSSPFRRGRDCESRRYFAGYLDHFMDFVWQQTVRIQVHQDDRFATGCLNQTEDSAVVLGVIVSPHADVVSVVLGLDADTPLVGPTHALWRNRSNTFVGVHV
jgi:hypothetical protein